MKGKTAWMTSATAAGGLLLAGVTAAAFPAASHSPSRAQLAAYSASAPSAVLDNCPVLAQGYQGGCVSQLQTELNTIDHAGLPVDGIFGPLTQQAVITFQQQHGLTPADGIVGPLTKAALDKASSSPSQPGSPAGSPVSLDNCPTLSEGYQGGCVNQLQTELNTIDHAGLPVDGIFGPLTQQAVITFQQNNGVSPADGIVGPLTKAALDSPGTPAAPSNGTPSGPVTLDNCPVLAQGSQGGCVSQLQTELNTIDHAGLPVDGIFGPLTRQAVITFQQQNDMSPADGIVGPQTKQALDEDLSSVATPGPGAPSRTPAPQEPNGRATSDIPGVTGYSDSVDKAGTVICEVGGHGLGELALGPVLGLATGLLCDTIGSVAFAPPAG
jgi:peptidoglycan hydrolase-like protein with peptidoglycan-binding domain